MEAREEEKRDAKDKPDRFIRRLQHLFATTLNEHPEHPNDSDTTSGDSSTIKAKTVSDTTSTAEMRQNPADIFADLQRDYTNAFNTLPKMDEERLAALLGDDVAALESDVAAAGGRSPAYSAPGGDTPRSVNSVSGLSMVEPINFNRAQSVVDFPTAHSVVSAASSKAHSERPKNLGPKKTPLKIKLQKSSKPTVVEYISKSEEEAVFKKHRLDRGHYTEAMIDKLFYDHKGTFQWGQLDNDRRLWLLETLTKRFPTTSGNPATLRKYCWTVVSRMRGKRGLRR